MLVELARQAVVAGGTGSYYPSDGWPWAACCSLGTTHHNARGHPTALLSWLKGLPAAAARQRFFCWRMVGVPTFLNSS